MNARVARSARTAQRLLRCALVSVAPVTSAAAQGSNSAVAGDDRVRFRSQTWCADSGTVCWAGGADRQWFNGMRIVAELDLGLVFQSGRNKFEGGVRALPKLALEFNIYGGWAAAQLALLGPSKTTFDESSETGLAYLLPSYRATRTVPTTWGWLVGLSVLDGTLMGGYGSLHYDKRAFARTVADSVLRRLGVVDQVAFGGLTSDSFGYAGLQPISSIRASFKRAKEDTDRP